MIGNFEPLSPGPDISRYLPKPFETDLTEEFTSATPATTKVYFRYFTSRNMSTTILYSQYALENTASLIQSFKLFEESAFLTQLFWTLAVFSWVICYEAIILAERHSKY